MLLPFNRRLVGFLLAGLAICVAVTGLLLAFAGLHGAPPAPLPPLPLLVFTPTAPSSPTPVLTATSKPPQIDAKAVYLLDADTGNTLDDWHGELPLPMASTTKIMTALLAIQSSQLNQLVTVHQDAIDEVAPDGNPSDTPSSAHLRLGDCIPLSQLLYALMLPSGNDAAVAIADAVGGSRDKFVHMMNVEAYRLHLFSTHYTSPDGLIDSPDHHTTAYDLARLARYAMRLPLFAALVSKPLYVLPRTATHTAYVWTNTNELLEGETAAYPGATGIKTGHTDQAGECLIFSATRAHHHLIGILLSDTKTDPNQRFQDAHALLDWGFALPLKVPVA